MNDDFNINDYVLTPEQQEEMRRMQEEFKVRKPRNRYCSKTNRYKILQKQHWRCNKCECKLRYNGKKLFNGEVAHIDHIIPWSKRDTFKGNINNLSNLQALCPTCNLKKHAKVEL